MLALDPISQGWCRTQSGANPRRCDVRLCPHHRHRQYGVARPI